MYADNEQDFHTTDSFKIESGLHSEQVYIDEFRFNIKFHHSFWQQAMDTSTTFKVSEVKVERVTNLNIPNSVADCKECPSICSQIRAYDRNHCAKVFMETQFSQRVRASRNNGFFRTVIDCSTKHHNLIIRPDDIWTAILTQFSFYIHKNAEEFHSQFFNFDGKKELVVEVDGSISYAPCAIFETIMRERIDETLVDKTMKDWILPNFTTTTSNDIISSGTILWAVTKKYVDFAVCGKECGIPYVNLEGTIADWENILNRLEKLKNYKLANWYDMLKPILEEFVAAKKNEANVEFWKRICYSSSGYGPSHISGWLTAFAVFNEDGRDCVNLAARRFPSTCYDLGAWPVVEIDCIPSGIVTVDVKIVEQRKEHASVMFAGHVGYEVLEDDFTLRPKIGWGIALKLIAEDVEKLHETARGK